MTYLITPVFVHLAWQCTTFIVVKNFVFPNSCY